MNNQYISRRSFTHKLTKALFALAGIQVTVGLSHLMASNPPRGTPFNRMGPDCGNGGGECKGNCVNLGVATAFWTKCCYIPSPLGPGKGIWKCCTYMDFCAAKETIETTACRRQPDDQYIDPEQEQWCMNKTAIYVCTLTTCAGSHPDYKSCAKSCPSTPGQEKV